MSGTERTVRGPMASIRQVTDPLNRSDNHSDHRKAWDLEMLEDLSLNRWGKRFEIRGLARARDRSLVVICRMWATGTVWTNAKAQVREGWFELALSLPHSYPLSAPGLQFIDPVFNPHVVHREFLGNPAGLPAELQEWLRSAGRGGQVCYVAAAQWCADIRHNAGMALWQVSRILTGNKVWGENVSLNHAARDYFNEMQKEGRLPLGPPLPFPFEPEESQAHDAAEDIEWVQEEGGKSGE